MPCTRTWCSCRQPLLNRTHCAAEACTASWPVPCNAPGKWHLRGFSRCQHPCGTPPSQSSFIVRATSAQETQLREPNSREPAAYGGWGGPAPAAATPSTQFSASGQSRLTSKDTRRSGSQLPPLQTSWPPGCAALGPRSSSRWPDPRPAELAGHSPCPEGGGEEPVSMVATPDATQSGQKTGAPPGPLAPLTEDRPPPLSHEHLVVHLPSHSNSFPESSEVSLAQDQ